MALVKVKPTSPGRRSLVKVVNADLHKGAPHAALVEKQSKTGGRNHLGRVTSRRRGGGVKRLYRIIDFKRDKTGIEATVAHIEYDPNRTARIALLHYSDGEKRYILAPVGLKQGDKIMSGINERNGVVADIKPGNALQMARIPVGTVVHNIELYPGKGGQMCRAAGTYAQLVAKEGNYALLRLPSGEVRKVLATCVATVGQVGNVHHETISLGKAGRNRWLGRRPKVRGVAMNPIDHPLGGGEGRSSGGRHPVSPWGMPAKGYKTRDKKKASSRLIIKRRGQK